jgi:hypothetical protein
LSASDCGTLRVFIDIKGEKMATALSIPFFSPTGEFHSTEPPVLKGYVPRLSKTLDRNQYILFFFLHIYTPNKV